MPSSPGCSGRGALLRMVLPSVVISYSEPLDVLNVNACSTGAVSGSAVGFLPVGVCGGGTSSSAAGRFLPPMGGSSAVGLVPAVGSSTLGVSVGAVVCSGTGGRSDCKPLMMSSCTEGVRFSQGVLPSPFGVRFLISS